jgi:hypothetical protein
MPDGDSNLVAVLFSCALSPERTMSRLYRPVKQSEPLSQGDIFADIPIPTVSFQPPLIELHNEGNGRLFEREADGDLKQQMILAAAVELTAAIVLDQSCDTLSAFRQQGRRNWCDKVGVSVEQKVLQSFQSNNSFEKTWGKGW